MTFARFARRNCIEARWEQGQRRQKAGYWKLQEKYVVPLPLLHEVRNVERPQVQQQYPTKLYSRPFFL